MEPKKNRTKLWGAVLASLVLHFVIALMLAALSGVTSSAVPVVEGPAELTFVDLAPVSALATPVPNPTFLETEPGKESVEKPKDPMFESNANSIAASEAAVRGDQALPSQEGKDRPSLNVDTHQYSLPSEGAQPQPPPQPRQEPQKAATAVPSPEVKVTPTPRPSVAPTPTATPQPTPTPEKISTPEPDRFAMLTATPPPPMEPHEVTQSTETPEMAPSVAPRPRPEQPASSYRAQKEKTQIAGRISNKGPSAVNAVGTPLGRYQKALYDAVGSRWYHYTEKQRDLISIGTAHLRFSVDRTGQVKNLNVVENSSNETFANVCPQATLSAVASKFVAR